MTAAERHGRPASRGLAVRLFVAIMVVIVVAILAAWIVAAAVGPKVFHDHLTMAGSTDPLLSEHAEVAFSSALTTALVVALLGALVASIVASVMITRRIARSLRQISRASQAFASGDHLSRVMPSGLGPEVDDLGSAFNAMAEELGRVESTRTRMLGDLAHEMRTPVATLDAYLEALIDGVESPSAQTLTMLRAQTSRLSRLAEDISLVSAAEESRMSMRTQSVAVIDVVKRSRETAAARAAGQGVKLRAVCEHGAAHARVFADPERLDQVFPNLLNNALQHTPPGGHITIAASAASGWATFTVTDDGEGIPAAHLGQVFQRFYRVDAARDREHGGSGIGLSIVAAIVEAHHGTVAATSPGEGLGTTMTVCLLLER